MYSEAKFFSLNEESRTDLFDEPKTTQTYWQSLLYDFNIWRNIHNVHSKGKGNAEGGLLRDPDELDTSKNVIHGTTLYEDPESSIFTREREYLNFWFNYFANHWYMNVLQLSYKMLVIIACLAVIVGLMGRIENFVGTKPDDFAWRKDSFNDASVPNLLTSIEIALDQAGRVDLRKQGHAQWSFLSLLPLVNLFIVYFGTLLLYFISCHLGGMSVLVDRQVLSTRAWKTWGLMILFSRIFALALMLYYPAQSNQESSRCEIFMGGLELTIFGKVAFLSPALPLFFNIMVEMVLSSFTLSLPVPWIYYHPAVFFINLLVIRNLIWSCVFKGMSDAMMGSIFPVANYLMMSSFLSYADRIFTSFHTQRNALLATRVRKNIELFLLSISSDIGKSLQLLSFFSLEESPSSDKRRIHSLQSAGSVPASLLSEKASVTSERMKLVFQIMNDGLVFDCLAEDLPITTLIQSCAKLTVRRTREPDTHETMSAVVKNAALKKLMLFDYAVCIEYAAVDGLVIHTSNSVLVQFIQTLLEYLREAYDALLDGPRSPELQHALAKRNNLIAAWRKQSSSTPMNNKRSKEDHSRATNALNMSIPPIFTVNISLLNANNAQFSSAFDVKLDSSKETYVRFDVSCSFSSAIPYTSFDANSSSGMLLLTSLAGMSGGFIQRGNDHPGELAADPPSSESRGSNSDRSAMSSNHQLSSSFSAVLGCSCDPRRYVSKPMPNSEYFGSKESEGSERLKGMISNAGGVHEEGEAAAMYFNSRRMGRGGTPFRAKPLKLHRILSHKLTETMKPNDKQLVGTGNKRTGAGLNVFVISEDVMFHNFVVNLCKIVKMDTALTIADQVSEVREQLMQLSRTNPLGCCVVFCTSASACVQLQAEDYRGYLVFAIGSRFNVPKVILPTTLILQFPAVSADVEAIVKLLDSSSHQDLLPQPVSVRADMGRLSSSVDVLSQIDEDISLIAGSESAFSLVEVVPDIFASLAQSTLHLAVYLFTTIEFPFSIFISLGSHAFALLFHYSSKFLIFCLLIVGNFWEVFLRIRGESKNPFVAHPHIARDYVCHNYFLYYYDLFKPLNPGADRVSFYQSEFNRLAPRKFIKIGPNSGSNNSAQSWYGLLINPSSLLRVVERCTEALGAEICEMRKNIFVQASSTDVYDGHDTNHRCAYRKYGSDMQLGKLFYLPKRMSLAYNFFAPSFSAEVENSFQWGFYFLKTLRDRGAEPLVARAVWTWYTTFILFAPILWLVVSFIPGAFAVSMHCLQERYHFSINMVLGVLMTVAVSQFWRLGQFPSLRNSFFFRYKLSNFVRIVPVLFFASVWIFSQEIFVYFFSREVWVWLSSLWSPELKLKSRFREEAIFFCSDTNFGQVKDIVMDLLCPSVCFGAGVVMLSNMIVLLPGLFGSFLVACLLIMSYFYILFVCKTFLLDVFQISGILLFSVEKGKSSWILLQAFFYVFVFVCLATFTNGIISQKSKRSHYQAYRLYHMQSDFLRRCRDISRAEIIPLASKVLDVCNSKIGQLCDAAARPKLVLNSKVLSTLNQVVMGHLLLRTVVLGYDLSDRDHSRFNPESGRPNVDNGEFAPSQKRSSGVRNATNIVILRKKIEYWVSTCVAHSCFSNTKFLLQIEPSVSCVRINESALEMSIIAFVMTALDRILLSRRPSREQVVCIRVNQLETFASSAGAGGKLAGSFDLHNSNRKNPGVNAHSTPLNASRANASLPSFLDTRRLVIEILDTSLSKEILHSADCLPEVSSAGGQTSNHLYSRSSWMYEAGNAAGHSEYANVQKTSGIQEEPLRTLNTNYDMHTEFVSANMQTHEEAKTNAAAKGAMKRKDKNGELWNVSRLDFEFMSMFRRGVTDDFNMSMFGQLHTVEVLKEILMQLDKHAIYAHVAGTGNDINYGSHQVFSLPYQQLPIAARISEVEDVYMRILRDDSYIEFKQAADAQLLSARFDSSNHQLLGVVIFPADESYSNKFKAEMVTHGWRHIAIDLANFVSGNVENVEWLLKADCVFVSIKPDTYVSALNKLILAGMKATLVGVDFTESKHRLMTSNDSLAHTSTQRYISSNATPNISWSNQQNTREKISANDIKFHFTVSAETISQQHLDLVVDFTNRKRLKRIFTIPDD